VAGGFVFSAWITQADKQFDHGGDYLRTQ
jgi:hypothetical protein